MRVVDASAIAEVVLDTARGSAVRGVLGQHTLHAPELMTIEITSVVRRLWLSESIDGVIAHRAIEDVSHLGVEYYGHEPFLARSLELRHALTSYDALYVALAEALDAPLVTCDAALARSHGHRARVELITA